MHFSNKEILKILSNSTTKVTNLKTYLQIPANTIFYNSYLSSHTYNIESKIHTSSFLIETDIIIARTELEELPLGTIVSRSQKYEHHEKGSLLVVYNKGIFYPEEAQKAENLKKIIEIYFKK